MLEQGQGLRESEEFDFLLRVLEAAGAFYAGELLGHLCTLEKPFWVL